MLSAAPHTEGRHASGHVASLESSSEVSQRYVRPGHLPIPSSLDRVQYVRMQGRADTLKRSRCTAVSPSGRVSVRPALSVGNRVPRGVLPVGFAEPLWDAECAGFLRLAVQRTVRPTRIWTCADGGGRTLWRWCLGHPCRRFGCTQIPLFVPPSRPAGYCAGDVAGERGRSPAIP